MSFGTPLELLAVAALAVRRFGLGRTLLASVALFPVYLWSLPPVTCSCFGPTFRRCDNSIRWEAAVKSDLKNLASQQEIYYSDFYTYSQNAEELGFVTSQGVTVTIFTTEGGWGAVASHQVTPERGCAIYWGEQPLAANGLFGSGAPGEIVCQR